MRGNKSIAMRLVLTFICLLLLQGIAGAQGFSAEMVMKAGGQVMKGKMFVSADKMRFETTESITITRMDKKVVWMLMPAEKMYMEQPFNPSNIVPSKEPSAGEVERKLLGTETVDGKTANKYRITAKDGTGKNFYFLQWLDQSSGFPLKMAAEDGSWVQEYKNITIGSPDNSLFELPSGYQKFSMSMGMPMKF